MNKKTLLIVIAVLFVGVVLWYIYSTKKEKEKAKNSFTSGGENVGGVPRLATPPIAGNAQNAPITQTQPIVADNAVLANPVLVKLVQAAVGAAIDGKFGPKTNAAVIASGLDVSNEKAVLDRLVSMDAATHQQFFPLKRGSRNNYVKGLQIFLGIKADGIFGSGTEAALKKAIGKKQCSHRDYVALFSKASGKKVTINGNFLTDAIRLTEQERENTKKEAKELLNRGTNWLKQTFIK